MPSTSATMSMFGSRFGKSTGEAPFQCWPMLIRMNDIPIAEISGASLGALRSGR